MRSDKRCLIKAHIENILFGYKNVIKLFQRFILKNLWNRTVNNYSLLVQDLFVPETNNLILKKKD